MALKDWLQIRKYSTDSLCFKNIEDIDRASNRAREIKILFPNNAFTDTSNYVVRIGVPFRNLTERKEFKTKKGALNHAKKYMRTH